MKIKIGVAEHVFKTPSSLIIHFTIKAALIHRANLNIGQKLHNYVLLVWDDQDNLLAAKNIDEELKRRRENFQSRCNQLKDHNKFDVVAYQLIVELSYTELDQILKDALE